MTHRPNPALQPQLALTGELCAAPLPLTCAGLGHFSVLRVLARTQFRNSRACAIQFCVYEGAR